MYLSYFLLFLHFFYKAYFCGQRFDLKGRKPQEINGNAKGYANGAANGKANGLPNGLSNGLTNGYTKAEINSRPKAE